MMIINKLTPHQLHTHLCPQFFKMVPMKPYYFHIFREPVIPLSKGIHFIYVSEMDHWYNTLLYTTVYTLLLTVSILDYN